MASHNSSSLDNTATTCNDTSCDNNINNCSNTLCDNNNVDRDHDVAFNIFDSDDFDYNNNVDEYDDITCSDSEDDITTHTGRPTTPEQCYLDIQEPRLEIPELYGMRNVTVTHDVVLLNAHDTHSNVNNNTSNAIQNDVLQNNTHTIHNMAVDVNNTHILSNLQYVPNNAAHRYWSAWGKKHYIYHSWRNDEQLNKFSQKSTKLHPYTYIVRKQDEVDLSIKLRDEAMKMVADEINEWKEEFCKSMEKEMDEFTRVVDGGKRYLGEFDVRRAHRNNSHDLHEAHDMNNMNDEEEYLENNLENDEA